MDNEWNDIMNIMPVQKLGAGCHYERSGCPFASREAMEKSRRCVIWRRQQQPLLLSTEHGVEPQQLKEALDVLKRISDRSDVHIIVYFWTSGPLMCSCVVEKVEEELYINPYTL